MPLTMRPKRHIVDVPACVLSFGKMVHDHALGHGLKIHLL